MRILITGAAGQLGRAIVRRATDGRHEILATSRAGLDVRSADCAERVAAAQPDCVINAAAMTDVDGCERDSDSAFRINAIGARNVAHGAERAGATLVQISTDYVFPGRMGRGEPYWEFDPPEPLSVYGASKLAGERLAKERCRRTYVVRTAWLYGVGGSGFVPRMLDLATRGEQLSVVDNEFGNPTFCDDLADALLDLIEHDAFGTYHLVNEGWCSRYDLAMAIVQLAGLEETQVQAIDHYPRVASPPKFAPLRNFVGRELGVTLPPWREGLARFFARRETPATPVSG